MGNISRKRIKREFINDRFRRKQKTEINISQLYLDFIGVVRDLEKGVEIKISEHKLDLHNWTSRQDVIMKFKRTPPPENK